MRYESIVKGMKGAPLTQKPGLLVVAVELAADCFQSDDDLHQLVRQIVRKHRQKHPSPYKCPHCGAPFNSLSEGLVPTHDFPKPCRSVCPGSRNEARVAADDSQLWKDA